MQKATTAIAAIFVLGGLYCAPYKYMLKAPVTHPVLQIELEGYDDDVEKQIAISYYQTTTYVTTTNVQTGATTTSPRTETHYIYKELGGQKRIVKVGFKVKNPGTDRLKFDWNEFALLYTNKRGTKTVKPSFVAKKGLPRLFYPDGKAAHPPDERRALKDELDGDYERPVYVNPTDDRRLVLFYLLEAMELPIKIMSFSQEFELPRK